MLYQMLTVLAIVCAADAEKVLPPEKARQKIGETITVEMADQTAKDRLEKRLCHPW